MNNKKKMLLYFWLESSFNLAAAGFTRDSNSLFLIADDDNKGYSIKINLLVKHFCFVDEVTGQLIRCFFFGIHHIEHLFFTQP